MRFKKILKKVFRFDEYMRVYLVGFSILYVMGFIGNMSLIGEYGVLKYILFMIGVFIIIILALHVFQWMCRIVGVEKIYNRFKERFKK